MTIRRITLTYKYRVKDKHAAELNRQARAVSYVWNFCNETSRKAWDRDRRWLSAFDLGKLTAGSSKELCLHAHTIKRVCDEFAKARDKAKRASIRWRAKKSLGWVPFNTGHVTARGGAFMFRGFRYDVWMHRELPEGAMLGAGSFNQDAGGRWYLNVPVGVECSADAPNGSVGIDLGLKELATTSGGEVIAMPSFYRKSEQALGTAQRAKKTKRARAIHRKAADRRKDYLHKASRKLASENGLIVVGDVSPSKLAKTRMAKSVLDAGWSDFRKMLEYKAIRHGSRYVEVSEAYTTQTCSGCGSLPASRPRGIAGLSNRVWRCDCGVVHDRDVNAARNILAIGLDSLTGGAHG